jgi:hypothetical protein
VDFLEKAKQALNETNFVLNVADGISTDTTKAQSEIATEWKLFRLSYMAMDNGL